MEPRTENPKADRIERLLYVCALFGVLTGAYQWAAGHYIRALIAAAIFLVLIPWLGKKCINRSDR
jgi:hypothetical protein